MKGLNKLTTNIQISDIVKQFGLGEVTWTLGENGTIHIHAENESFILHQSNMDNARLKQWERVFRIAHEKQLRSVIPVYPTIEGNLFVQEQQNIFYLTPYIEEIQPCSPADVMSEIGVIHAQSHHTFLIDKNTVLNRYSTYKSKLQANQTNLRQLIDLFEQQRYMSPLGLQICSHFHIVDDAIKKGMEHVDAIIRICKEEEHEHIEWSSSICHNRLSMDNVIKNNHVFVDNWEGSTFENGTMDLTRFLNNEFLRNEFPLDNFVEGLRRYEKTKPMNSIEKHILNIHMLHPVHYLNMISSIHKTKQQNSHLQRVIAIERMFRVLSSGLYVMNTFEQPVISD